jgi:hypothetical protein
MELTPPKNSKKVLKSQQEPVNNRGVIDLDPKLAENMKEALSFQGRLKRANQMRRKERKLQSRKEISLKRNASMSTLRRRARVSAISRFKTRLAGGRDVSTLSSEEKRRIEKIMQGVGGRNVIARLTTKMMTVVREREKKRHQQKK